MPYTTVATNDVLTATHFNTNYRDQVISQVSSGTQPSGVQGQLIYEANTNRMYVYTGSAWEQVGRFAGLDNWTPTVTQSGAVTATVVEAQYQKIGRLCWCYFYLAVTGTGTGNNSITIGGLPFSAASGQTIPWGTGFWYDSTAGGSYCGQIGQASATTLRFFDTALGPIQYLGVTGSSNNDAVENGDVLTGSFQYVTTT